MGIMGQGTRLQNGTPSSAVNQTRDYQLTCSQDVGGPQVTSTGISFSGGNTIADSNNGLGVLSAGQDVKISGGGLPYDMTVQLATVSAGSCTITPTTGTALPNLSAGVAITISQN